MKHIFEKDPDSKLDYIWDWTAWLDVDTISTFSFEVPDGITLSSSPAAEKMAGNQKIKAWFEGGTARESYPVTCRITTVNGRQEDKTAIFKMKSK